MMWLIRIRLNLNSSCCYFQGCTFMMLKYEVSAELGVHTHTHTHTMEELIIRDKDKKVIKDS